MKNIWNSIVVAILVASCAMAQEQPVKILFDVTSSDTKVQEAAVRHVDMMSKTYTDSEFEVVMYGGSSQMALQGKSTVEDKVRELVARENVKFVMCEGTLRRKEIKKSELIPGVGTVPDGILELVNKQQQGWGYIKEGG
ncbi:DsrE family protein [Robertkochia flava]|uniref:DsrE family protein n=1 Tax=Robertkochia flava TaxID=3447986 RepID=UPI001CCBC186|nr:DsrE family protein [Robertkochia marina]